MSSTTAATPSPAIAAPTPSPVLPVEDSQPTLDLKETSPMTPNDDKAPPSLSQTYPQFIETDALKLQRAHERERQRSKTIAGRMKSLSLIRTAATAAGGVGRFKFKGSGTIHSPQTQQSPRAPVRITEEDYDTLLINPEDNPYPDEKRNTLIRSITVNNNVMTHPRFGFGNHGQDDSMKNEVRLIDLISTAPRTRTNHSQSKSRGLLKEFELIPPLRSVIILDDRDSLGFGEIRQPGLAIGGGGVGLDETWEYIDHDSEEDDQASGGGKAVSTLPISYANAVVGAVSGAGGPKA